jgi:hypothetical protein
MTLKAVVFGFDGVMVKPNQRENSHSPVARSEDIKPELQQVFQFLRDRGIKPIVLSNREWRVRLAGGAPTITMDEYLLREFGTNTLYVTSRGDLCAYKPLRACIDDLLRRERLRREEVAMVGMSEKDFRTAINSKLLFLNANWGATESKYGFQFDKPSDVLRFIDLFALRDHYWFYEIDDPVQYRSMAPYSTFNEESRAYSEAAERALKRVTADRHFFLNAAVASLYFSGLIQDIKYIACVPGHRQGFGNPAMDDILVTVGEIFRAPYLRDLIVRHVDVVSSRGERVAGRQPAPESQFNSIHLTRRPLLNGDKRFKSGIDLRGKRVAVFDDFTTSGYTFEAARHFVEQAGGEALLVSCFKSINRGYRVVTLKTEEFNPWQPLTLNPGDLTYDVLPYSEYITANSAPLELARSFIRYKKWTPSVALTSRS